LEDAILLFAMLKQDADCAAENKAEMKGICINYILACKIFYLLLPGVCTQIYAQCRSWQGPLSLVLYLETHDHGPGLDPGRSLRGLLRAKLLQAAQFVADMSKEANSCSPDVTLVWESFPDGRTAHVLYPINILREFARLQASSNLVPPALMVLHAM
jgi:hypothetical protein